MAEYLLFRQVFLFPLIPLERSYNKKAPSVKNAPHHFRGMVLDREGFFIVLGNQEDLR